jgi:hypothetical protein
LPKWRRKNKYGLSAFFQQSLALGSGCMLVVLAAQKKLAPGYHFHPAAAGHRNSLSAKAFINIQILLQR